MLDDRLNTVMYDVLCHARSIEERLKWSKSLEQLVQRDKYVFTQAINKINSALKDILSLGSKKGVEQIKEKIYSTDVVYFMFLTEQLFPRSEDDLSEIAELIDKHLNDKYVTNKVRNDD